jgi:hypothetical protein
LFYLQKEGLFDLNQKADAAEAMVSILNLLHSSLCPDYGCVAKKPEIMIPRGKW